MGRIASLLLAGTLAAVVPGKDVRAASSVYRCGAVYQETPCASAGRQLDLARAPNDAQRSEAHAIAQREADLASRMTKDRERAEAAHRPAQASGFDARAERKTAKAGKAVRKRSGKRAEETAAARRRAEADGTAYRVPPPATTDPVTRRR